MTSGYLRGGEVKYGLLDYELINGRFNLGDYVQSLAAEQYLPRVDALLNREELSLYAGDSVAMILNGWFMQRPENWPPALGIDPLFLSFHMNRPYISRMLSDRAIAYMKAHGPIGCRDYYTAEVLEKKGVDSYYSCCLTTTLGRSYGQTGPRQGVLFVDLMHNVPELSAYARMPLRYLASHMKSGNVFRSFRRRSLQAQLLAAVPAELAPEVAFLENHIDGASLAPEARLEMARVYLRRLAAARFVVTSRIHCALPCLALGTPVVFVKYGQKSLSNIYRFRGILDHMNVIDLDGDMAGHGFASTFLQPGDIDWLRPPANPDTHLPYAAELATAAAAFIATREAGRT